MFYASIYNLFHEVAAKIATRSEGPPACRKNRASPPNRHPHPATERPPLEAHQESVLFKPHRLKTFLCSYLNPYLSLCARTDSWVHIVCSTTRANHSTTWEHQKILDQNAQHGSWALAGIQFCSMVYVFRCVFWLCLFKDTPATPPGRIDFCIIHLKDC
jgi:hypothetical protein